MTEIKLEIHMLTYGLSYYTDSIDKTMFDKLLKATIPTMQQDTILLTHLSSMSLVTLDDVVWYDCDVLTYKHGAYKIDNTNVEIIISEAGSPYNFIKIIETTNKVNHTFYKYDKKITELATDISQNLPKILI